MVKTQQPKRIIIVKRDKRDCKVDILKEEKGIDREEGAFLKDINPQECVNTKSKNNNKKAFIHEYNIVGAFSFFQKMSISEIFLLNTYC